MAFRPRTMLYIQPRIQYGYSLLVWFWSRWKPHSFLKISRLYFWSAIGTHRRKKRIVLKALKELKNRPSNPLYSYELLVILRTCIIRYKKGACKNTVPKSNNLCSKIIPLMRQWLNSWIILLLPLQFLPDPTQYIATSISDAPSHGGMTTMYKI